ncbi:MAG: acetate kinase [Oscillospiraceae bacterium]|nr:acetate kinase [Oscillospiraceae bacterium]
MNVLVINAGSSSLKYQLFDMETEEVLAKGNCDRIGTSGFMKHKPLSNNKPVFESEIDLPSHKEAIAAVIEKLTCDEYGVIASLAEINAVGHRVVNGGSKLTEGVLIDQAVIDAIEKCIPLAPNHNPANLTGIDACRTAMPGVPNVAVFDTGFHSTIPDYAYTYAIPYKYLEENDIRRYGFHGTSHSFVAKKAAELLQKPDAKGTKIITCHFGNGVSLAAIKDGESIDTTMGLTPLEGMPMGTRSGSVDPALFSVLAEQDGLSVKETLDMLNNESGVLGVSGLSNDFRDVEAKAGFDINTGDRDESVEIDKRSKLALDIFCYQAAKYIGSYIAVMGGVDAIVFTAGVGENSPYTRRGVCSFLNGIGICIDEEANKFRGRDYITDITGEDSIAKVFVIPTDEELVIARDTKKLVSG